MKKLVKKISAALLIVPLLALSLGVFAPTTYAACDSDSVKTGLNGAIGDDSCAKDAAESSGMQTGSLFGNGSIINNIINIALFIVGILCVIMIIYSGIRYVISRGNPEEVKNAKNTLLYAIIGLIIAIIAWALVNFVFTSIGKSS